MIVYVSLCHATEHVVPNFLSVRGCMYVCPLISQKLEIKLQYSLFIGLDIFQHIPPLSFLEIGSVVL